MALGVLNGRFQFQRATKEEWEDANIVLLDGELALESDTTKIKAGDGKTPYTELPYITIGSVAFSEISEEDKKALVGPKGDPFTYDDFTQKQLDQLKGKDGTVKFDDLTEEQRKSLQVDVVDEVHSALILKRDKSTPIGINDLDGETLGIIQDGSGGMPIEVLSIPRDKSVTEEKTTFLIHDETTNLIDKTTVLKDTYINGAVDGKEKIFVDTNTFYATDFIPIEPGTPYYHGSLYNGYFAFYDANKTYISGTGIADGSSMLKNPFTGPQNAHYIRVTIRRDSNLPLSWINKTNEKPADMRYKWKNISFDDEQLTQLEDIIDNKNYLTEVKETDLTFLELAEGSNLIIQSEILYDSYIKGDDQGQVVAGSGLKATGYVELKPDTDYYFSDLYKGYYAFYDENKVYITGSGFDGVGPLPALISPFQIPSNAKYGRFTIGAKHNPANAWINTENATPPAELKYHFKDNILVTAKNVVEASDGVPTEYNGDDIAIFNHILAIGDSLTAGTFNVRSGQTNYVTHEQYAYPAYLQKMTGVSVTNKGHGGKTTKEWFDIYGSEDLSGYDCAIIQLGVNDLIRESTLVETKTYLTNIINKLKTENTGIKIFVSTIIPATSYSNAGYIAISEAIREVVATITSDVYLVDLAVYGHTKDEVAYNNGHLSAYGYWQLAKDYKAYISYIIANNKLAFRNIQFAGTDYTY